MKHLMIGSSGALKKCQFFLPIATCQEIIYFYTFQGLCLITVNCICFLAKEKKKSLILVTICRGRISLVYIMKSLDTKALIIHDLSPLNHSQRFFSLLSSGFSTWYPLCTFAKCHYPKIVYLKVKKRNLYDSTINTLIIYEFSLLHA